MKKGIWLSVIVCMLMLGLSGCGRNALEGNCECIVALTEIPKELEMLDENILDEFYIKVELENIYSEKSMDVKLTADNDFQVKLKLQPGTYLVRYLYAAPSYLVPVEVASRQEKVELTKDSKTTVDIFITNQEDFSDWLWNMDPSREVLQEDAFSHRVQFEGKMIDIEDITDYVEFSYDSSLRAYEKATISNSEKGVTITVLNDSNIDAVWQDCKLIEVSFSKNNIIWGQGAFVGMDVTKAVNAKTGLYGEPSSMAGTILAGLGYSSTKVSWLDETSGDKLTLMIAPDGDSISGITYAFEAYE